jgi:hypothetical protein
VTDELRVVAERVRAAVREGCRDDVATALHGLGEDACRALRKELLAELKADAALCQQASASRAWRTGTTSTGGGQPAGWRSWGLVWSEMCGHS